MLQLGLVGRRAGDVAVEEDAELHAGSPGSRARDVLMYSLKTAVCQGAGRQSAAGCATMPRADRRIRPRRRHRRRRRRRRRLVPTRPRCRALAPRPLIAGTLPIALLQVGAARMSVHPVAAPAAPHAERPHARLRRPLLPLRRPGRRDPGAARPRDVPMIDGPVARSRVHRRARGLGVYLRDPRRQSARAARARRAG